MLAELRAKVAELERAQTQPPGSPPPAPAAGEIDTSAWLPEEVDELETARAVERYLPTKYAGWPNKVADFKTKHDEYIRTATEEDQSRTFDENDARYQEWLSSNRPVIPAKDRRAAERAALKEEVLGEVGRETEGRLRERMEIVYEPVIEQGVREMAVGAMDMLASDPAIAPIVELARTDQKKLLDNYPMEAGIINQILSAYMPVAKSYQRLALKLDDLKPSNEMAWLANYVKAAGEDFEENGAEKRIRSAPDSGVQQTFMSRAKFAGLVEKARRGDNEAASQVTKHWTYTDRDVLQLIALQANRDIASRLKNHWEQLAKAGYKRETPAPSSTPRTPQAVASPSVTPSSSPGATGGGAPAPTAKGALTKDELEALGVAHLVPVS